MGAWASPASLGQSNRRVGPYRGGSFFLATLFFTTSAIEKFPFSSPRFVAAKHQPRPSVEKRCSLLFYPQGSAKRQPLTSYTCRRKRYRPRPWHLSYPIFEVPRWRGRRASLWGSHFSRALILVPIISPICLMIMPTSSRFAEVTSPLPDEKEALCSWAFPGLESGSPHSIVRELLPKAVYPAPE